MRRPNNWRRLRRRRPFEVNRPDPLKLEMTTARTTISQALVTASALGLDRLDAQLLMLHALGKLPSDRAWLLAHDLDALPESGKALFQALVQRRATGEPVAYLTGRKEFYGLDLGVDARVLVPRPDTETLVEWALALIGASKSTTSPRRVIDLGTGSGAIALAMKHARGQLQIAATDISADALAVARANALQLKLDVQFSQRAWLEGVTGRFEVIVSNPPYIALHDPHLPALAHEPLQALVSGADGLDDIRHIIAQAPDHLNASGWLLLEHGFDQAAKVRTLLLSEGFTSVVSRRDLGGHERCSGGQIV